MSNCYYACIASHLKVLNEHATLISQFTEIELTNLKALLSASVYCN